MATEHEARAGAGAVSEPGERSGSAAPGKRALTDRLARRGTRKHAASQGDHGHPRAAAGPELDPFDYLAGGAGRQRKGGGHGGKGKTADGPPTKLLAEVATNSYQDEHQFAAMVGREDGVTPAATFQVTDASGQPAPGIDVAVVTIAERTTVLRSAQGRIVLPRDGAVLVTIPAAAAQELHGDGSIGDDQDGRLEA